MQGGQRQWEVLNRMGGHRWRTSRPSNAGRPVRANRPREEEEDTPRFPDPSDPIQPGDYVEIIRGRVPAAHRNQLTGRRGYVLETGQTGSATWAVVWVRALHAIATIRTHALDRRGTRRMAVLNNMMREESIRHGRQPTRLG